MEKQIVIIDKSIQTYFLNFFQGSFFKGILTISALHIKIGLMALDK